MDTDPIAKKEAQMFTTVGITKKIESVPSIKTSSTKYMIFFGRLSYEPSFQFNASFALYLKTLDKVYFACKEG